MHVDEKWFTLIKNNIKTVEGRKHSEKWSVLKKGSLLKIFSDNDYIIRKIKDIRIYSSLEEFIINEGLRNILPGVKTLEEGVDIYLQYFTKEDIKKYGMMAIEL